MVAIFLSREALASVKVWESKNAMDKTNNVLEVLFPSVIMKKPANVKMQDVTIAMQQST